jgi:serine/threonine-protein kinase
MPQSSEAVSQDPVRGDSRYTPIAELGRGGMATAFLSVMRGPRGFNKLVVVKRLRAALAAEPEFVRMFLDEARLAARIDHPNVVHTSEVGLEGQECFIAMEFVDGQPYENVVRRAKRTAANDTSFEAIEAAPGAPLRLGLLVVGAVLDALHFAHELKDFDGTPLNVVHRDVSPHNVMITYEGHIKLLDFGIAKAADSTAETRTGVIKGKCGYMAPEQFGGGQVDRRADVFAVGVMLWQAITGRKMWQRLSDVEIFQRLARGRIPPPSSVASDVDSDLEAICMRALAPQVEDRYPTAADMRTALDDYLEAHPDKRASSRELGRYVTEMFEGDRAKIHALIEAQVARAKSDEAVDDLMNLSEYFGASGTRRATAQVPPPPEPAPSSRKRWVIAAVASTLVLATALVVAYETRSWKRSAAAANAASRPTSDLLVHVFPTDAKVTLDGEPLTGSPPHGVFPLDGAQHRVYAEAPGYVSRSSSVLLDSDRVTLDLSLEPAATPPKSSVFLAGPSSSPEVAPATRRVTGGVRRGGAAQAQALTAPTATPESAAPPPTAAPPATTAPTPAPAHSWPTGPALDKTDPWAAPPKP